MSSITPVSYQPTYIPVTPVRPVVSSASGPAARADNDGDKDGPPPAAVSAATAPGTGTVLDIKV